MVGTEGFSPSVPNFNGREKMRIIKRIGHTLAELLVPVFIYVLICINDGYVISKIIGVYYEENLILKSIVVTVNNIAFGCILLLIYRYLFRMKIKEYFVSSVFDVKKYFVSFCLDKDK